MHGRSIAATAVPASLFERLRTRLPSDETRIYMVRATDYRREFVGAPTGPAVTVSTGVSVIP